MNIKEVIKAINQMQVDGVIERYAIGGAVGATFYIEPSSTLDVDIFITYKPDESSLLVSLKPIYDYWSAHGGTFEKEYIVIAGTPVQFITAPDPLVEEALRDAVEKDVDGIPARVFSAEHLAAVALQTGRTKDKMRLNQFLEESALDIPRFEQILTRHNLIQRWHKFQKQYLDEQE